MVSDIALVELRPEQLAAIEEALSAAGLPHEDVRAPGRRFYRLGEGFVGLEVCGADALLRSVVVPERLRGTGAGRALVTAAMGEARRLGVTRLWLLTTTPAGFFRHLGFAPADRAAAPAAIQATTAFRDLCPASALCLVIDLDGNRQDG